MVEATVVVGETLTGNVVGTGAIVVVVGVVVGVTASVDVVAGATAIDVVNHNGRCIRGNRDTRIREHRAIAACPKF